MLHRLINVTYELINSVDLSETLIDILHIEDSSMELSGPIFLVCYFYCAYFCLDQSRRSENDHCVLFLYRCDSLHIHKTSVGVAGGIISHDRYIPVEQHGRNTVCAEANDIEFTAFIDDIYDILLKKWNEYLYKLKSGQHLTEMIGHALKNTTDIREHMEEIRICLRGHNLYDIFYGRFRKNETEILKSYIEEAPRDTFKDILDAIDRFVYFENRKK